MSIRLLPAGPEHLDEVARSLACAGLPGDDVRLPGRWFFRAVDADGPVGFGGLEGEGPDVLLRSVLVHPGARGRGHGAGVVYYLDGGAVRGVLLWNVWDSVPLARELIESTRAEPVADPQSLRGRIPLG